MKKAIIALIVAVTVTCLSIMGCMHNIPYEEAKQEVSTEECSAPISVEEEFKPVYDYTEEELDLLARLIYSEGNNESYDTQLKIGSVVMNRVEDPYFPDTIETVIYQKNQFAVTYLKNNGIVMIEHPPDEEAKQVAFDVLNYGSVLPEKVQVFYNKNVNTGWVTTREPFGTFDNTTFAYIYEKEGS